jgi:Ca2+-dependent lipid-binding protein
VTALGKLFDILVDNGFNPVWNEMCEFDIRNPDVALIRFVIQDEDMFGDPNFLGQATFPVRCLRAGNYVSFFLPHFLAGAY